MAEVSIGQCVNACMTALRKHVFPKFFNPGRWQGAETATLVVGTTSDLDSEAEVGGARGASLVLSPPVIAFAPAFAAPGAGAATLALALPLGATAASGAAFALFGLSLRVSLNIAFWGAAFASGAATSFTAAIRRAVAFSLLAPPPPPPPPLLVLAPPPAAVDFVAAWGLCLLVGMAFLKTLAAALALSRFPASISAGLFFFVIVIYGGNRGRVNSAALGR